MEEEKKRTAFQKYVVPGLIFQGIAIAGGYGTGRELVEYFLRFGPFSGIIAMLIPMVIYSLAAALCYELARLWKTYNYGGFFKHLLGKFWWAYEITYLYTVICVIAVVASAAGAAFETAFHLNVMIGAAALVIFVGYLTILGNKWIEKIFSYWSTALYIMYSVFLVICFVKYGGNIVESFKNSAFNTGVLFSGFKYAMYNISEIPLVFFVVENMRSRKEATTAGILSGPLVIVPGILLLVSLCSLYPSILKVPIPSVTILGTIKFKPLMIAFQIILFGTLVQTGTGVIFAFVERIKGIAADHGVNVTKKTTFIITICVLVVCIFVSMIGVIDLIAKAYGFMSWLNVVTLFIPLITIGVYKLHKLHQANPEA